MSQTTITDIGTVGIPVSDQDKAVEFFTGTLGFEKRLDARMGESFRWVTVAAPGASTSVALIVRPDTGADTGRRHVASLTRFCSGTCRDPAGSHWLAAELSCVTAGRCRHPCPPAWPI